MKQLFLLLLLIGTIACNKGHVKSKNRDVNIIPSVVTDKNSLTPNKVDKTSELSKINKTLVWAIRDKNYKTFSEYIHPTKGLRFSMYGFVNIEEDKIFSKDDFIKHLPSNILFTWGKQDGTGNPFRATVKEYFSKWVYPKDFANAKVTVNQFQAEGNSLNNLKEIYPESDFVENYIKGTVENSELDWKTLRFVFEELDGKYYLVGLINDQWTV